VLTFIEDERRRSGIVIRADLDPDLPGVDGDAIQLQQVVLNLLLNGIDAMRASPPSDRLLLVRSTFEPPGMVKVAVEDRGSGLEQEVIDQLFTPLFTTKKAGIGLGLAITRSIVESHGGRIWAEPVIPHGALFQFVLPAATGDGRARVSPPEGAVA
jgi:signal transduction histidine kinase